MPDRIRRIRGHEEHGQDRYVSVHMPEVGAEYVEIYVPAGRVRLDRRELTKLVTTLSEAEYRLSTGQYYQPRTSYES